ncbi:MAG: helix-hairpin-helix domain-containing protein [Polaromonas sp.]|nr:helix-hairpin-helix domain-containing protein [Polaromonas sp.]
MGKAMQASEARVLTDIPNIGKSLAVDLQSVGIESPSDVKRMNVLATYEALRSPMGNRHDPCVLDTCMAAKKFMNGGPKQPWWDFTAERKALLATQDRK